MMVARADHDMQPEEFTQYEGPWQDTIVSSSGRDPDRLSFYEEAAAYLGVNAFRNPWAAGGSAVVRSEPTNFEGVGASFSINSAETFYLTYPDLETMLRYNEVFMRSEVHAYLRAYADLRSLECADDGDCRTGTWARATLDYEIGGQRAAYEVVAETDASGAPVNPRYDRLVFDTLLTTHELLATDNLLTETFDFGIQVGGLAVVNYGYNAEATSDFSKTFQIDAILLSDGSGGYLTPESVGIVVTSASGLPSPNSVPEPWSIALGALALIGGVRRPRRATDCDIKRPIR
jgi:hypothetical protein